MQDPESLLASYESLDHDLVPEAVLALESEDYPIQNQVEALEDRYEIVEEIGAHRPAVQVKGRGARGDLVKPWIDIVGTNFGGPNIVACSFQCVHEPEGNNCFS